jgi:hypothetical protein
MAMEAFPIAAHTPARTEPRHERVPALRLHAHRDVIADGTTIAIREDEEEHDRRYHDAQDEKGNENRSEYHSATSREAGSKARAYELEPRENRTDFREARADAR